METNDKTSGLEHLNVRVRLIDSETQLFTTALGITPEREKLIFSKMIELMEAEPAKLVTDIIIELSKVCVHPNELAWIMFQVGYNIKNKQMSSHPLLAFLKGLMKNDD